MRQLIIFVVCFLILNTCYLILATSVHAIYDPLSVTNNKVGIHLIAPTPSESSPAAALANTNGDWGYITILVESGGRDQTKWQQFFNDLRRRHLIPIVRIASQPDPSGFWKRPYEGEEKAWADFLDSLIWPTKNRYVSIYNEPNHATEWGNTVDPRDYAKTLDKTITALKDKNPDFFVLNAGFDASAPQKLPAYMDQLQFMREMNAEVPGIFNKLDGWVSHSYPNPGFVGSPDASGRISVRGYLWEKEVLASLGVIKDLPVFITETGWKHAEGINFDRTLPSADIVAEYYKKSFESAWNNNRIVAVTPFLLTYQEFPFDHFSFKKPTGGGQDVRILGVNSPDYYPQYEVLANLPKQKGRPIQERKAKLEKGVIYTSVVAGEEYTIPLVIKNTGQSIWNESSQVKLAALEGGKELGIQNIAIPIEKKVEPGEEYTFNVSLKAPQGGIFKVKLVMVDGIRQFDSPPFEFTTEVKSPVKLSVLASLKWKKDFGGEYLLNAGGVLVNSLADTMVKFMLNNSGKSEDVEVRALLPDYTYDFTLKKPFYHPKTIRQTVHSGTNKLDFGQLQPDIPSAILHPVELWHLLPWSN